MQDTYRTSGRHAVVAPDKADQRTDDLPEHQIRLSGGEWALWRWAGLRGPGFPAAQLLQLAAPACAAAADALQQAEADAERLRQEALAGVNSAREALRQQGDENLERRAALQRAARLLRKGRLPDPGQLDGLAPVEQLRAAYARIEDLQADFHKHWGDAMARIAEEIHAVARGDRFREAIIWQNRQALHNTIDPLLRNGPQVRDANQRRREQVIATYLQRYCAKNDTIGFFGPVGWASLQREGPALTARPGEGLVAARSADFESWCIEALARTLAENPKIKPWIAPRRLPFFYLEDNTLYVPGKAPAQIPPPQAALLHACDGERTARAIAEALMAQGLPLRAEDVYQGLEQLRAAGLIVWTLEVPVEGHAERALRRQLNRIEQPEERQAALGALDELEHLYGKVAEAAGDASRLDHAMGDLEAAFTRLTGASSTRAAGQTYAGRTLVYEDCRRDIEASVGPQLLEALGPPLTLLLDGARWFTYQTACIYRAAFKQLYAELVRATGAATIDAVVFWQQAQPILMDEQQRPLEQLLTDFQRRWAEIFDLPSDERQVSYTSAELRPRVRAAFDAPRAGWRRTRYHGPDILIDAPSVEAIQRGEYQLVLGEIHIGANPLLTPYFRGQHTDPDALMGYFDRDLPEGHLVPVPSKDWPVVTTRTPLVIARPKDWLLAAFPDACGLPKEQAVPIGELVIEDVDGELIVRTRDGRLRFEIIEAFAGLLQFLAFNYFRILPSAGYTPRVIIDNLVIQREAWSFTTDQFAWVHEKSEAERFLAARRWAHAHGLPRWCFAKTPVEIKPFYVDFQSPIYIDLFARMIRRTQEANRPGAQISVSEMLPDHGALWLSDMEGQRYTSELRFVAFDLTE